MKHATIKQAMEHVANNPYSSTPPIDMPVHEVVCRQLFDIANSPNPKVRGSMSRASTAQKLILDRMVGTRKAGSHPAARTEEAIEFADLTAGILTQGGEPDAAEGEGSDRTEKA